LKKIPALQPLASWGSTKAHQKSILLHPMAGMGDEKKEADEDGDEGAWG
jgi:hypothetical protein